MIVSSDEVRSKWGKMVKEVMAGETVVVDRYKKPVAALIPYEDFVALQDHLEDLSDARRLEELMAEWEALEAEQDLLHGDAR